MRAFLSVCNSHNSPVFLADPGILQSLDLPLVDPADIDKLLQSARVISFGVLDNQWTIAQKV